MSTLTRTWTDFRVFLEMIKIEHSIFALPFALIGTLWAAQDDSKALWPGGVTVLWIVVAMVSCRSAAMAFNRIADRDIDVQNPRTATRAIPAGLLSLRKASMFFFGSIGIFLLAASQLQPLALALSPIVLIVTLGYSKMKRVSWLCHWVLGLSLGIAPAAAYIAVTNTLSPDIVCLTLAVMFWTAGFDLIYALQDDEFDRSHQLHSVPARFGRKRALWISRINHFLAIGCLVGAGLVRNPGVFYWVGVALAAALLAYEQSLVKPDDLRKVNMAFFTLNGYVSLGLFGFVFLDQVNRI